MGTVPMGTGELRMIQPRMLWMLRPVERSMTVSPPQRMAQTSFFDFFGGAGGDGGVADVGVDLDEEVAADDDGFELGMVDVGGDDGPAAGDFAADELGGDEVGDFGAEAFAVGDGSAAVVWGVARPRFSRWAT